VEQQLLVAPLGPVGLAAQLGARGAVEKGWKSSRTMCGSAPTLTLQAESLEEGFHPLPDRVSDGSYDV